MIRARLAVLLATAVGAACGSAPEPPPVASGALAAGGRETYATLSHACAVVDGGVQCWGASARGQVGDAMLARQRPLPVRVPLPGPVRRVAAGGSHSCAASRTDVYCWGDNAQRQAGPRRPFVVLAPLRVDGLPEDVAALAAGLDHTCAVAGGSVWCWGRNEAGESGTPPPPRCRAPLRVRRCVQGPRPVGGLPDGVSALALGERHSCALAAGEVWCWGAGGDPQGRAGPVPVRVDGLDGPARAIAAGRRHTCALVGARLRCWGAGSPPTPAGWGEARAVAAGGGTTCVADVRGVRCAGPDDAAPRPVPGTAGAVTALAVGLDLGCARVDGEVRCWGENDSGQLGAGAGVAGGPEARPVAAWDTGGLRDVQGDGRITVVCLGDSNTEAQDGIPAPWCDRLPALLDAPRWRVVNRGLGGATATGSASLLAAAGPVAYAIEHDAPDVAILAYGSNDVFAGTPAAEIVAATGAHVSRLAEAGIPAFVALTPPVRSSDAESNAAIRALNEALRAAFPPERLLDFASGVTDAELLDRVHLGEAAQVRRARVAAEALRRALGERGR